MHKEEEWRGGGLERMCECGGKGVQEEATEEERDGLYVHETVHGYTAHITDC